MTGSDSTPPAQTPPAGDRIAPAGDRPNIARAMDYLLGGAASLPADRALAHRWEHHNPLLRQRVRDSRASLHYAVLAAAARGVNRMVELCGGAATTAAPHHALIHHPDVSMTYVESDVIGLFSARHRLDLRHYAVQADLRRPAVAWARVTTAWKTPPDRPVALLAVGLPDHLPPDHDATALLSAWRCALPAGSLLVFSASITTPPVPGPAAGQAVGDLVTRAGWALPAPVARAHHWRPHPDTARRPVAAPDLASAPVCIAVKPDTATCDGSGVIATHPPASATRMPPAMTRRCPGCPRCPGRPPPT